MRVVVIALLVGCATPAPSTHRPAGAPVGCTADAAMREECAARGPAYRLTPGPSSECRGVHERPEDIAESAARRADRPCMCMTQHEIDRGTKPCGPVP